MIPVSPVVQAFVLTTGSTGGKAAIDCTALTHAEGNRYLDFSGSTAVNFIGHGVREVADAMLEQAGRKTTAGSNHRGPHRPEFSPVTSVLPVVKNQESEPQGTQGSQRRDYV